MSTPSNPIVRAVTAVVTGGLSEVPGQYKAAGAAIQGKNPVSAFKEGGSPTDAFVPKVPSPSIPDIAPATSPESLTSSPAASPRRRRYFSTILTNPRDLVTDPSFMKRTTLLGSNSLKFTLGQ